MKKIYSRLFIGLCFFSFLGVKNATGQTPVPMATQPGLTYTENFADIANWTNAFASGTGANRFGSVAVNATGTIPDGVRTSAATATFATGSGGGVQKGSTQTPAAQNIVLLATGATDNTSAVAIDFFMDFTGTNAGTLSFDWGVIFNSTGNRAGSLRVYASTNGTTFTEITSAQVLNFVNNVAGSGSITTVALPAAFNNSATARLRFYYNNGSGGTTGSRPKISIDNLTVTATLSGTPALTVTPTTLNFPSTDINTSSSPQTYTVTGANLTAPVVITTAAPYSICETIGGTYVTSLNIPAVDVVLPKTIYVKFEPTVAGTITGAVDNNSTGATQASVSLSGIAFDPSAPLITVAPATLSFPATGTGTDATSLTYTLTATNLTNDVSLTTTVPYSLSVDNTTFTTSLNILSTDPTLATGKTIFVRFSPVTSGVFNAAITNSTTGATDKTITLSGTGVGLINLIASPYLQNFDGIGSGLPTGISVKTAATASALGTNAAFATAHAQWNATSGGFKNFASGNNDEGVTQSTATDRAIGVRQVGATDPGTAFVFQVANTTGKINFVLDFNLQSLDASSARVTSWRVDYGFGVNPSTFIVPATTGILTTGGNSFTNNPIHVNFGNALDNQPGIITIRIVAITASSGSLNRPSTGIDDFTLSWEDPTAKTISLNTTALIFPATNVGASSTRTYTIVSQTNLDEPILISTAAPYSISADNLTFSSDLSVAPADAFNKTIYVKFEPTAIGVYNGSVLNTSVGAVSKTVNLSGEAIDPTSLAFTFNSCSVSSIPGSGFLSLNVTGTQKWGCSQYGRNSSNGVDVNGFSGGSAQTNDAWLISPALNLNSIVNIPVLSFYSRGEYSGPKVQLYVSTTYDGSSVPNIADWTEITTANFPTPPGVATTVWTLSDNIDLSAYKAAPSVYIAFRYTSSAALNAARWAVDDIAITDQSSLLSVSPSQLSFGEIASGSNSASQPVLFQAIGGSSDFTVTPPAGYQVSADNITFITTGLVVPQASASAGTTLYIRFSPTVKALKIEGNVTVTATGLNKNVVAVTGSSYPKSETFDVATYNVSFFGANSTNNATPTEIATQVANITTVVQRLNMDVIGIQEMSNDAALAQLVGNLPGYASTIANRWSYSFDPPDPGFPPQKIGFIYNTATMALSATEPPRVMFESMYDSARLSLPGHRLTDYPTGTPSSFWGSGRLPFMATFDVTIGCATRKVRLIVLHAKSGGNADGYTRRQYDVKVLKDSIDAFYASDSVIILGDYNDRIVTSIYPGNPTSYLPFVNNSNYNILTLPLDQAGRSSFPSSNGMIDHITVTNEFTSEYISTSADIEDPRLYIPNYTATTASDHLPVISRFALVDKIAPVITCPSSINVNTTANQCTAIVTFATPSATDNCAGVTVTTIPASGSSFAIGTTPVTVTATDAAGNISTCTFNVIVTDAQAPSITCLANVTVSCASAVPAVNIADVTATDNCAGVIVTHVSDVISAQTCANKYVITRTYLATDAAGLTATCAQTITVNDETAPVIPVIANISVTTGAGQCNAIVTFTPTATDGCAGAVTVTSVPASGSVFPIGTTTVIVTATDLCGNSSTRQFNVTVTDGQLPLINTQPVNRTVCAGSNTTFTVVAANATAYQWQQYINGNWTNIAGATTATLSVNAVTLAMNTNTYRVNVTGVCNSAISGTATLFVNALPTISLTASNGSVLLPGQTTSIIANVNPTGGTFAWLKNGVPRVPTVTTGTLSNLTVDDAGIYRTSYTDPNGCVSSSGDLVISAEISDRLFVAPNPNYGQFWIRYYNQTGETLTIAVFDSKGNRVHQQQTATGIAYTRIDVDMGIQAAGIYVVELRGNSSRLLGRKQMIVGQR